MDYTVTNIDTFTGIASKFNMTVDELAAENLILPVGKVLKVTSLNTEPEAPSVTLKGAARKHNIIMGAAVADHLLDGAGARQRLALEYSSLTPENAMKWGQIEPTRGNFQWAKPDRLVDFAQSNGQKVHGHTLLWHTEMPSWAGPEDLDRHIRTIVGRYKGKIQSWDVVNEVLSDNGGLRNVWYRDLIGKAFRIAHEVDPDAKLYINDYNIEDGRPKTMEMLSLVKRLLSEGVPIHGVGFQCHFHTGWTPAAALLNSMKLFTDLGLEVAVTEFDCAIKSGDTLEVQGIRYRDMMTTAIKAKAARFITWGFTDKSTWLPGQRPLPFDENYQKKPAYKAMLDRLNEGGVVSPVDPPSPPAKVRFADLGPGGVVADNKILQDALNQEFGGVVIDGDYGPQTREAYSRWQELIGTSALPYDGLPGKVSLPPLATKYNFTVDYISAASNNPVNITGKISPRSVLFTKTSNRSGRAFAEETIRAGLTQMGLPVTNFWIDGYLTMASRESSYNPNAVNTYDSNAINPPGYSNASDGAPFQCSRGMWQCIPQTFATYHQAGTSLSIYDPIASFCASVNYVRSVYKVNTDGSNLTQRVQQADPDRTPKGY